MKRAATLLTATALFAALSCTSLAGWPDYQIEPSGVLSLDMDLQPVLHEDETISRLTLTVHGIPEGHPTLGIANTEANPFRIYAFFGEPEFFNSSGFGTSQPFAATPAVGHPQNLDSGFLGAGFNGFGSDWGAPASNMSTWAMTGESIIEYSGAGDWLADEPVAAPAGGIPILRASWDGFSTFAEGTFLLRLAEPLEGHTEFCVRWTTAPPIDYCDLDGDEVMGVPDLLIMLEQWGQCELCDTCRADLNGDRSVGVPDLLILLDQWGLEFCKPKE